MHATLQKAGLTKTQISTVDRNLSDFKVKSSSDVDLVVEKLEKDIRFRSDFFKDPETAMDKIILHRSK
jgi:hypothetical protein